MTKFSKTRVLFTSLIVILGVFSISMNDSNKPDSITNQPTESLYDQKINSIDDEAINLSEFKGKKILFVNVASKCGYTPQYADLQKLHEMYNEKLVIIGIPCNQFLKQEPGTNEEIKSFCQKNYGVSFLITEKVDVKGTSQHPLYSWLTSKEKNGKMDTKVKWNFQKYLIDEKGELIEMFPSNVNPLDEELVKLI